MKKAIPLAALGFASVAAGFIGVGGVRLFLRPDRAPAAPRVDLDMPLRDALAPIARPPVPLPPNAPASAVRRAAEEKRLLQKDFSAFGRKRKARSRAALRREAPAYTPGRARSDKRVLALASKPAEFLAKKTNLARPERLRAFMNDAKRVQAYVSHPLVRGFLNSPRMVAWLLSRPGLVAGFIKSPAMRDPATVAALAKSPLLRALMKGKGVQAALADPVLVKRLMADAKLFGTDPALFGALVR